MLKKSVLLSLTLFLIGCFATATEPVNNTSSYEYRIIEDPSSGVLTAFYEKDGNLYYRQITNAHSSGDNISLSDDGWTELKPPGEDSNFISAQ